MNTIIIAEFVIFILFVTFLVFIFIGLKRFQRASEDNLQGIFKRRIHSNYCSIEKDDYFLLNLYKKIPKREGVYLESLLNKEYVDDLNKHLNFLESFMVYRVKFEFIFLLMYNDVITFKRCSFIFKDDMIFDQYKRMHSILEGAVLGGFELNDDENFFYNYMKSLDFLTIKARD